MTTRRIFAFVLLSLFIFCPGMGFARTFTGEGVGSTSEEARKEALADLSQALYVEVASEFSSVVTQSNTETDFEKTKQINVSSRLPLFGAEFTDMPSNGGFKALASLSETNRPMYEKERVALRGEVEALLPKVDAAKGNAAKVGLLEEILTKLDRADRVGVVTRLLGGEAATAPVITEAEVKSRISKLEKKADSLDYGLKLMARGIGKKRVFIFPPRTGNSQEVTQFAGAVKSHLSMYLDTTDTLDDADYYMTGEYARLDNAIELTYRLMDRDQTTLQTAMAWFLPSAYAQYEVNPATTDFHRLIASGLVVSSDFKASIRTSDGQSDLLYRKGDLIRLLVKVNRPGYFYLMSHSLKEQPYSYLVHLNDAPGNRKFISYIGPDEAGKWVELGEFEAVPPFGVETLQIFASTQDLVNRVPKAFLDPETQLYKVGTPDKGVVAPEKALVATRGLMLKKKNKTSYSEASLTFTTMKE
ncbi:hypothetical protein DSLASN_03790 [Desulfoluna limicola]|uniref:DUF4384 domain-containing protein n=1 Tax=Desulfoluna limicola TaxID=2810562 RepID=A0ABN6F087_9BACT|nr:hypothetical protein [Desulfoluna limicola]BCS94747.1 hypothetical protein DSLASN_03790 [Desulfoluna limicola]